jgi:hypothetical protein
VGNKSTYTASTPDAALLQTTSFWSGRRFCRINKMTMLTTEQINDLHRFYWSERWPIRKIERHLEMGWKTIKEYLDAPAQGPSTRERVSKLDPFKGHIAEWLEKDPRVTAAVVEQRLRPLGYRYPMGWIGAIGVDARSQAWPGDPICAVHSCGRPTPRNAAGGLRQ